MGEIRYGLRPSLLSPMLHSNSKPPRKGLVQNQPLSTLIHSCQFKKQLLALGQYSIGRVGQLSIGADSNALKLGLALHIGFLRLSGRLLNSVRMVPADLWRHLGQELGVTAPELASLKALYGRGRTLFDHQQLACEVLGFRWMTEHQRRALVRILRDEVARCADRDQLLVFAMRWLYQSKILILRDRDIRVLVTAALAQLEEETAKAIAAAVSLELLSRWRSAMSAMRPDGQTQQSWLWAAPAKHSTKQIAEVFERIEFLYAVNVHQHLESLPNLVVRRYARRLASRPPSVGARIKEPARTVEVACFLRYCLFTATDQAILMVQRRVSDLWRTVEAGVTDSVNWAAMYKALLGELAGLLAQGELPDAELRSRIAALVSASQQRKPPSRASVVRERMIVAIRPVRALLFEITKLPWQADSEHPVTTAVAQLSKLYCDKRRELPVEIIAPRAWVQSGVLRSGVPTGSALSALWRWPLFFPCAGLYVTALSGSSTA